MAPAFSVVGGARHEDDPRASEQVEEPDRLETEGGECVLVEPGVVPEQLAAKRCEKRNERLGKAPAANEAHSLAGEQERAGVDTLVEQDLGPGANLGIAPRDIAG